MTDRKPATDVGARKLPAAPATKPQGGSVIRCIRLLAVLRSIISLVLSSTREPSSAALKVARLKHRRA